MSRYFDCEAACPDDDCSTIVSSFDGISNRSDNVSCGNSSHRPPVLLPPDNADAPPTEEGGNGKRFRAYCFTLHDWTPDEREQLVTLIEDKCKYGCFGEEVCPTTGRPHLQGYVYFPNKVTWNALKSISRRICIAVAKGNAEQNRVYCSKSGTAEPNLVRLHALMFPGFLGIAVKTYVFWKIFDLTSLVLIFCLLCWIKCLCLFSLVLVISVSLQLPSFTCLVLITLMSVILRSPSRTASSF